MRRVMALVGYQVRELFRSLTGMLVVVAALVFYLVGILSVTGGVDRDYFGLVIGGFFGLYSMMVALVLSDRAYRASSYLVVSRLPARAALLAALIISSVLISLVAELVVAAMSLPRLVSPFTVTAALEMLPVWISWLVLGAVLGIHMSELVRRGWSRTVIYGVLAFVLFVLNQQQGGVPIELADQFSWVPSLMTDRAKWGWAFNLVEVITWPVAASIKVARETPYTILDGLSPAVTVLASIALFGLASELFDGKDLILPEN